ncbi:MAG: hypothetical protein KAJ52_06270 [Sedimentisphaerales bacterium]|nr:hypothetical protein [Sedimentisphaerales bacterium]
MAVGDQIIHILKSYVLKLYTIGFAILLIVMVIWLLRGYQKGVYWNAKRARSAGDIALATQLFEEAVRQDAKGLSFKALLALIKIDEPQSLSHMIELIDVPEMNYIAVNARVMMCEVIRKRTTSTTADSLPLDPCASQEVRAEQKQRWQAWLARAKEKYDWQNGKFIPKQSEN